MLSGNLPWIVKEKVEDTGLERCFLHMKLMVFFSQMQGGIILNNFTKLTCICLFSDPASSTLKSQFVVRKLPYWKEE